MPLTAIPVKDNSKEYRDFISLYHTAFPPSELIPAEYFQASIHIEGAEVTSYYTENTSGGQEFVGFTYVIDTTDFLFIYFFAVNQNLRSRGFGSEIICNHLMKRYPGKILVLNAECPDETAPDNSLRLRRIAFYERLGFVQVNCTFYDERVLFTILSTSPALDIDRYKAFLQKLYDLQNLPDTVYILPV